MPESPTSLALARRPGLPAVVRSRHRSAAVPIVALAALAGSLLLPLGMVALTASASVLGLVGVAVAAAPLRSAWAAHTVRRARQTRRDVRTHKLSPTSVGHATLGELTRLADEIELRAPDIAEQVDLEGLLDRHVDLTVGYERALRALQLTDRAHLVRLRNAYRFDPNVDPRRLELCERRIRCHDECHARAEQFADQLAILADTLHLIAQHAACPDEPAPDDLVDRQLASLDDHEAAYRQLTAELH